MQNISTNETTKTQAAATSAEILETMTDTRAQLDALCIKLDAIGERITPTAPDTLPHNGVCLIIRDEVYDACAELDAAAKTFDLAVQNFCESIEALTKDITPCRDVKAWRKVLDTQRYLISHHEGNIRYAINFLTRQANAFAEVATFAVNETLPNTAHSSHVLDGMSEHDPN